MNKKKVLTFVCIIAAFLLIAYGFVPQVLSGNIVNQSDISGWQGMSREMMEWNAAHPEDQTEWTESMFGGMPTTTIHSSTKGDWTQPIYDLLLVGRRPATYLFISLLGAWLLMLALGIHPLIAVGGAIAVTFCSYNIQIIQVGHNTKMQALAFLPWVLAALIWTYRTAIGKQSVGLSVRRWLPMTTLGAALFALALSFQIKANHPQITYYLAILILLYAIVILVRLLVSKKHRDRIGRFFAASGLLLVLGCIGISTNAIKLLPTYEYTPYSMRGGSSSAAEGDGDKGLKLDYATAWSYGWQELPNLLIPNFNGGSSAGAVNPKHSQTYDLLKSAGQPNLNEISKNLPLYWGPQPFTAGPMYMGAITLFLFVLGLFLYKGREKWWIVIATILAVFLALGNHFMWFTKLFYDYVPFYDKFRTVSMALVILQFTLPILAFLVLDRIIKAGVSTEQFKSKGWIALAITGGFCLICALFPGVAGSFTGSADTGQQDILVSALIADRRHLLVMDAIRSLFLIVAAYLLLFWGYSIPKNARETFATQHYAGYGRRCTAAILVCFLVFVDLFTVDKRYLNSDDFVSPRTFHNQFAKRAVDEEILKDTDPSYRVLDLTVNVFNDSHPSYWHKNIGGYSPAKLQLYQEFIEKTLTGEIDKVYKAVSSAKTVQEAENALPYLPGLAEMNCRYIIIGADTPPLRYPYAKGNAWFDTDVAPSDSSATVALTSYAPNELRYKYSAQAAKTMVFSEVYYPAGWSLTVADTGEILPIRQRDGILREATVPAGEHELVMSFNPSSYRIGEKVSRAGSMTIIIVVLLSIAGAAIPRLRKKGI